MSAVPLPVVSIGYLAAGRLAGLKEATLKVHSRFHHTMNLLLPDGDLLTLSGAGQDMDLPDGLRVALPPGWDWRRDGAPAVSLAGDELTTDLWRIAPRNASCWHPAACAGERPADAGGSHALLAAQLQRYCRMHDVVSDLLLLPHNMAGQQNRPLRQVSLALADSNDQLCAQADALIGYGRGLTPDGDDYLLGYLAALWPWRHPAVYGHRRRLAEIVRQRLTRTNDISRHYLKRATEGHFSAPVCRLQRQLTLPPQTAPLESAALQVMQFGAGSGADCLAGLLHGLRNLQTLH